MSDSDIFTLAVWIPGAIISLIFWGRFLNWLDPTDPKELNDNQVIGCLLMGPGLVVVMVMTVSIWIVYRVLKSVFVLLKLFWDIGGRKDERSS